MPKIYRRNCNLCGDYYEGEGKLYCGKKCSGIVQRGKSKPRKVSLWDRFWAKVDMPDPIECWEWQGMKKPGWGGYGLFWFDGTSQNKAHRTAWNLIYGDIPDGLGVLHTCDNPSCVNPLHLWLGTQRDNRLDMENKGRSRIVRGSKNCRCKLSEDKVRKMRLLRSQGVLGKDVANRFDISTSAVSQVANRRTWDYVE